MFTMLALLTEDFPSSPEQLDDSLKEYFKKDKDVVFAWREMPFPSGRPNYIFMQWNKEWSVVAFYENGESVLEDSIQIQKLLKKKAPAGIEKIDRRVRMVFHDDDTPTEKYMDCEAVMLMTFLESIPGAIIYDPQQNKVGFE